MTGLLRWLKGLLGGRTKVTPDGKGYRVNGEWCNSQVQVRQRLEELGHTETEIIRMLRDLNREKYGDPTR